MRTWSLLLLSATCAVFACSGEPTAPITPAPVASVRITPDSIGAYVADTITLAVALKDANANPLSDRVVSWSSLENGIASVNGSGRVVTSGVGRARIVVASEGRSDTAVVDIAPRPIGSVTLQADTVRLLAVDSLALAATVRDDRGTVVGGPSVAWLALDTLVARVGSTGLLRAVNAGQTRVIATAATRADTAWVIVSMRPVASVTISPDTGRLSAGDSTALSATVRNDLGTVMASEPVSWSSADTAIARVDASGRIFARVVGTTRITAASAGKADTAVIIVSPAVVARVVITPDSAVVNVNQSLGLTVKAFSASNAEIIGRTATWTVANSTIATVDSSGTVTGAIPGSTTVTATVEGRSDTIPVRVREHRAHSITVSPNGANLFVGASQAFTVRAFKADGVELTGRTASWTSANPSLVTVTGSGVATAVAAGSATLSVTVDTVTASVTVTVRENPVQSTSYGNFKGVGLLPASIPLPRTVNWGYHELARAYGDFFGNGNLDMFTSTVDYDLNDTPATAARAVYRFWRKNGDSYVEDNSILNAATPCLHSRKAIVADFNQDGRPDIFLGCTGYDASPFPGERNQVLLSQPDGRFSVSEAAPDTGFWHGVAAADLNGDSYPDVVAVAGTRRAVFLNDGTGRFSRETINRLPGDATYGFGGSSYFTVELVDVNEDGRVDLVMGGHEWNEGFGTTPTGVWLNPGSNMFSAVSPVVIPEVVNEGVVLDFTITGTGSTRTIWISRTSGGDGTFYQSAVMQRFGWSNRSATVVYNTRGVHWVPWIISYVRGGVRYMGSDDLRTPMEVVVP